MILKLKQSPNISYSMKIWNIIILRFLWIVVFLVVPLHTTTSASATQQVEEQVCTAEGECSNINTQQKRHGLGSAIGIIQKSDSRLNNEILKRINYAIDYVENDVMTNEKLKPIQHLCTNKHEYCAYWSARGECENNPAYMLENCAPMCHACELLQVETRCPLDPNATDALYPGDLDKLFERIINNPEYQEKYQLEILSRPPNGPWIVQFENFVTLNEASTLISLGTKQGYTLSTGVGKLQADGSHDRDEIETRTSTNAWCNNGCENDIVAQNVANRIESITGIPKENSEYFQLLKYEVNQFYKTHSDYIDYQKERPVGVRVLTMFLYLNNVESGGGTNFPELDVTVTPKVGRAILWPSVLNDDPNAQELRTDHQALPVENGVKYGANAWIHQREFRDNNKRRCA